MPIKIPSVPVQKEAQGTPSSRCISCEQTIAESYAAYLCDESRLPGGRADELIFAYSEAQIVEVLRRAKGTRTSVTLSAARTGIVGGAVPQGGILLSLEFMNRFIDAFPLEADPGVGVGVRREVEISQRVPHALEISTIKASSRSHSFRR